LEFDIETNRDDFKKDVPKGKGGIYFLYDKNMQLLYIGQTKNYVNRFDNHFYGPHHIGTKEISLLFHGFYYIKLVLIEDEFARINVEKELIKQYVPTCNTIGTGRCRMNKKINKLTSCVYASLPQTTLNSIQADVDQLNSECPGMNVTLNSWVRSAIDTRLKVINK
jgi:hypothetical protein